MRTRFILITLGCMMTCAACTGKGVVQATARPSKLATVSASHSPITTATAPGPLAAPLPPTNVSPGATDGLTPPIYRPSPIPTTLPSGYASPLPRNQFPADPSPTPTTASGSVNVAASPAPLATPTPGIPASMQVVSNTLDVGPGSVGGVVYSTPATTGGAPTLIGGGTINIVDQSDQTKRAVLTVGQDGLYRLSPLALKTYLVWVTRDGYTADTAPTEVTLSIGSNQNSNTPLVLIKTVPLPTSP